MRALHVSDLHVRDRDTREQGAALATLVELVDPELVIATGDLSHRGRVAQLTAARAVLDALGKPLLAVPGNHDLPHAVPQRFTSPSARFEAVFGSTSPSYRSDTLAVAGLDSTRPWRHQGGALSAARLERAADVLRAAPADALRVVALHHHLAGAPWRTSRKFPLRNRDRVLSSLAAAGAELVLGGHIHQCLVTMRSEFQALAVGTPSPVLVTAPGLHRPRPRRVGEAQGAVAYEWDAEILVVTSYLGAGTSFDAAGRREFVRMGRGTPESA
jgi:3',5'-cyclic AMP phosphodiesterase CpdA